MQWERLSDLYVEYPQAIPLLYIPQYLIHTCMQVVPKLVLSCREKGDDDRKLLCRGHYMTETDFDR
jgi:hypothetical protein